MRWSGGMMRSLDVTNTKVEGTTGTVTLGFHTDRANQLAWWHNVDGAGKGRVTHKFMGLTNPEMEETLTAWKNYVLVK